MWIPQQNNLQPLTQSLTQVFQQISHYVRFQNSSQLGSVVPKEVNQSGDLVKQLDILSNQWMCDALHTCSLVRAYSSEEEHNIVTTPFSQGKYFVAFDPLDGSSNIDVNITIGTIFGVFQYNVEGHLTNGRNLIMSGYVLYGGSTQLVVAEKGYSVKLYQLDENETFQWIQDLRIPSNGPMYSLNHSNQHKWYSANTLDTSVQNWVQELIEEGKTQRWVGSLVADGHRTLFKGGVFAYPGDYKNTEGKIRLLYEAYPMALVFEEAGGIAMNGYLHLLDIPFPHDNPHQKTPIWLGGVSEMEKWKKKILELRKR